MAARSLADLKYPDVFAALGKYIAEKNLQNVCVLEFEDGVILSGSVIYEGREGMQHTEETIILSGKEIEQLIHNTGGKRNLFGR